MCPATPDWLWRELVQPGSPTDLSCVASHKGGLTLSGMLEPDKRTGSPVLGLVLLFVWRFEKRGVALSVKRDSLVTRLTW